MFFSLLASLPLLPDILTYYSDGNLLRPFSLEGDGYFGVGYYLLDGEGGL